MRVYGIVSVGMLLPSDILYIRIQTIRLICYKCMTVFLVHIVHLRVCVHMCTSFCVCVCVCACACTCLSVCVCACVPCLMQRVLHTCTFSVCVCITRSVFCTHVREFCMRVNVSVFVLYMCTCTFQCVCVYIYCNLCKHVCAMRVLCICF